MKKEMRNEKFSSLVYKPVKEYSEYIKELAFGGLEIADVDEGTVGRSIDLGMLYGLLTADAIHLSTMRQYGIVHIATNDSDFERVDSIKVYKPENLTV